MVTIGIDLKGDYADLRLMRLLMATIVFVLGCLSLSNNGRSFTAIN